MTRNSEFGGKSARLVFLCLSLPVAPFCMLSRASELPHVARYRRHTNFALEAIEQSLSGTPGYNKNVVCTISRNGDLISDVVIEMTLKKTDAALNTYYPAEALISSVELEIGGQSIDKHTSDYLRMYDELMRSNDEKSGYRRMTDFVDGEPVGSVKRFYMPLVFFFNTNAGLSLPLIALQYHEVKFSCSLPQCGPKTAMLVSMPLSESFPPKRTLRKRIFATPFQLLEVPKDDYTYQVRSSSSPGWPRTSLGYGDNRAYVPAADLKICGGTMAHQQQRQLFRDFIMVGICL